jgi:hypothetical protein
MLRWYNQGIMARRHICAFVVAAGMLAALCACGGGKGQAFDVPTGPANMTGIYLGTVYSVLSSDTTDTISIAVELLETQAGLEAGMSYPDDPNVAKVYGMGSRNRGSFGVIMNEGTGREFYFEGTVGAGGELNGIIRYPDRIETLSVWALLQPAS